MRTVRAFSAAAPWLLASALSSPSLAASAAAAPATLTVAVDPRVELVSIVCRLAGASEYAQPSARSPYSDDVDAWFGKFKSHEAVTAMQRLRAERGISFNAPMDLAVHLTAVPELGERVPFDAPPARLDSRWRAEDAREMARLLRRFVADTRFEEFVASHRSFYARSAGRLQDVIRSHSDLAWLDRFFGSRPGARFVGIPGLLNGGASYGCGVVSPDGQEELLPILGAERWDAEGLPVFGADCVPTVVHELVHSYTNPLVDAWSDRLRPAGERLFAHCGPTMELQAYGSWKPMMYESLVRAVVVRYVGDTSGEEAERRAAELEEGRNGFAWTGSLARLLTVHERDARDDFAAFMPQVAAFFDGYSVEYDRRMRLAPRVVSLSPADGERDVDPGTSELVITFDRPMAPGSWALVGGGPAFPELVGTPSYDATGTVLRVGMRLEPGHDYRFGLNSLDHVGFRSRDGLVLQPVRVAFSTRSR